MKGFSKLELMRSNARTVMITQPLCNARHAQQKENVRNVAKVTITSMAYVLPVQMLRTAIHVAMDISLTV